MIPTRKSLWLALLTGVIMLLASGCNDTLRQFITEVPGPAGNPGRISNAIVLSTNPAVPTDGTVAVGSDLHIDVSGDSVAGIVPVGPNPVFLAKTLTKVFILNGDATVSSYQALLPEGATANTTILPAGTVALAGGFSSTGNFFVADQGGGVNVINASVNAVTDTLTVGTNPVMVAGNGANNKIYVLNNGSDDVTVISTIDNFISPNTIPMTDIVNHNGQSAHPIWGVMTPDGVHVFIVNQGDGIHTGWVTVIDTLLDVKIATIDVGISPNFAVFDPTNQRLYVSNTGSPFISVIKANGIDLANRIVPTKIADIPIPAPAVSVAALQDGTRAYAAMGGCPVGTTHLNIVANLASCPGNQVAVIDVQALALKKVITVGAGAVSIDAATNSSRVYVVGANVMAGTAHAANVSIINTGDDSVVGTIPIPQQSLGCQNATACPQNDTQIPFMVRVVP
ncbi:MAG TPA: YncE family protein [Candidatus Angelobacter sp.]|nr:YncE family protein [Candidatus Angelobacter sp.]